MSNGEKKKEIQAVTLPIKIDLGCGSKKQKDHIGLDRIAFVDVDHVLEIGRDRWPFEDGSVAEAYSSHCLEHLKPFERCFFMNELHRVLVPGGKCQLIVPHWGSCRAYGDPTHAWPPMGEFFFYYLSREWRLGNEKKNLPANAPHTDIKHWPLGYDCDFECTWSYVPNTNLNGRNSEFINFAINYYREAVHDIHATLTKK